MTKDFNTLITDLEGQIKQLKNQINEIIEEIKGVGFAKALEIEQVGQKIRLEHSSITQPQSTAKLDLNTNFSSMVDKNVVSSALFEIFKIDKEDNK